jgi:hydrogenase nickel incorporation protein HypA/HybF
MHELSIANSLLDVITETLIRQDAARAQRVVVEVGALSGVVPAALRSAFTTAVRGTELAGVELELREVPVELWCDVCNAQRLAMSVQRMHCAACGTPSSRVVRGKELELVSIEVLDAAENS